MSRTNDAERELRDKLRRIEALYAGATTEGERMAAAAALDRIRKRLTEFQQKEREVEFKFNLTDEWSRKLFVALCRRYGLEPFRYKRQRHTTVMVVAPPTFVQKTLWPEFRAYQQALEQYLSEATNRIIREEVFGDTGEPLGR